MHRVEDHVLASIAAGMAGDDLSTAADDNLIDIRAPGKWTSECRQVIPARGKSD